MGSSRESVITTLIGPLLGYCCLPQQSIAKLLEALWPAAVLTGVTQVSREKQVPFDVLPKPAPGLKTADPIVKLLHALSNAPCTRYTYEQLKPLEGAVKYATNTAPCEQLYNTEAAPLNIAQVFRHRCMT